MEELLGVLARSELFKAAAAKIVADYGQDVPPAVLYSGLGRTLAREFNSLSPTERAQLCDAVEDAMDCDERRRVELVATGLLEALFTASVALSRWDQVEPLLGIRSRDYLSAWVRWGERIAPDGRFAGS